MKTAYIEFCTNFNGVYLGFNFDDVTKEMEDVADDVSGTFPSLTYDMVEKFDVYIDGDNQQMLIDKANGMLRDAGIDDVTVTQFIHNTSDT